MKAYLTGGGAVEIDIAAQVVGGAEFAQTLQVISLSLCRCGASVISGKQSRGCLLLYSDIMSDREGAVPVDRAGSGRGGICGYDVEHYQLPEIQ